MQCMVFIAHIFDRALHPLVWQTWQVYLELQKRKKREKKGRNVSRPLREAFRLSPPLFALVLVFSQLGLVHVRSAC